jgi:hypothetical protein
MSAVQQIKKQTKDMLILKQKSGMFSRCSWVDDHLPMIRFHGEGGQSSAWQSQRIGVVTEGQGDNCWDL